ncbi:sn-glycerol-3-phosphate ABC transporter ATP-binding protein UgpC [Variovorax dokdonensis]|uniref:Sn-glycerol-3-phosphate ABC transporter ATP-binding protein UgpC n=1 Tax=Variovorax dokdonensis TaxID=344883 RepID=A0ABT7NA71_9BURK|nr:sn-glycerol-3-phosphate ABC transporter ATP-binding protein UgpC [Variovorax dokdonensis]MDM0044823.1 sn-glycerol-3-phosphate ABC transporter ATP-binding protein UgpC [Variovorax dokdonensis]
MTAVETSATASAQAIELRRVRKDFEGHPVIQGVDLRIEPGEFCVFVGPSGCGKSTLLRLVAGLESPSAGEVLIGERDVTELAPRERGVAMVFQSYALYPHMTVHENIAFGLETGRGLGRAQIDAKVREAADRLELTPLLKRLPRQLSGGQRQRVAIGRAIVREPSVFLFDEPLSNLDAQLRVQTRLEIARLHQAMKTTMVYVTHDQVEAMTLADRIVVLNAGRIEQVGAPKELYQRPRNLFVAGFIGSARMNFLPVRVLDCGAGRVGVQLPGGGVMHIPAQGEGITPGETLTLGIRPEHIAHDFGDAAIEGPIEVVEELGEDRLVYLRSPDGTLLCARWGTEPPLGEGTTTRMYLLASRCHLFGADGAALDAP